MMTHVASATALVRPVTWKNHPLRVALVASSAAVVGLKDRLVGHIVEGSTGHAGTDVPAA